MSRAARQGDRPPRRPQPVNHLPPRAHPRLRGIRAPSARRLLRRRPRAATPLPRRRLRPRPASPVPRRARPPRAGHRSVGLPRAAQRRRHRRGRGGGGAGVALPGGLRGGARGLRTCDGAGQGPARGPAAPPASRLPARAGPARLHLEHHDRR